MTFGEKLKKARTESGLKQSELAKQLNTTNTTISNWENNISKPDLDTLAYICGVLNVTASYFLQAKLPQDEISLTEFRIIEKYRDLDNHGKEMVDFVLNREYERSVTATNLNENKIYDFIPQKNMYVAEKSADYMNAASARTGIKVDEGIDTSENDIMDDDDF